MMKLLLACILVAAVQSVELDDVSNYFGGNDADSYKTWVKNRGSLYPNNSFFVAPSVNGETSEGAAVHWKIQDEKVYLAVAARATGWVGFGIADAGGMKGAGM